MPINFCLIQMLYDQRNQKSSRSSSPSDPKQESTVEAVTVSDGVVTQHHEPPRSRSFWNSFSSPRQKKRRDANTSWKPVTLQAPVLGGFIVFSVALIAVLEILSHISSKHGSGGGLAFAADVQSLPAGVNLGYLYLPTVLAVVYSMIWSWVDLDVKRLEPWFQLSKAGGATADDSLTLQYPFDFLPFVPVAALRRKHLGVFIAGTIMLMVFWIITPLQSAIFNIGIVTRSTPVQMTYSSVLPDIDQQTSKLNVNFLNTAYGVTWLAQRLPAFTTMEYATIPFRPSSETSLKPSSLETWTGYVETYSTSLNCTPATVTKQPVYYTFDNNRGCVVPEIDLMLSQTELEYQFAVQYIGYYADEHVDWSLKNPQCSSEHSNNFLAIWATNMVAGQPEISSNVTALFCVPSYHTQSVMVTVNATTGAVVDSTDNSTSSRVDLPQGVLNTTQFEYVIGAGLSSTTERKNHEDSLVLEQYPRLTGFNLLWPVSNAVGFAVGLSGLPTEQLSDPSTLHQVFERAHKLLFSAAFSTLLTPSNDTQHTWRGIREDRPGAIILVRAICIVVEVVLGLIALLTVFLWYISYSRQSNLPFDPASIADVVSILPPDTKIAQGLEKDSASLNKRQIKYQLVRNSDSMALITVPPATFNEVRDGDQEQKKYRTRASKKELFVRPRELRAWTGASLIGIILGSLGIIVYLLVKSSKDNGLNLPSSNPIVLSILENYLPTIFATFLEPAWVILNRLLCLLQPFEELRRGSARFRKSIGAKYTSLPPQLTVLRAMRSGHIMLAAVGMITMSTNVLAVALAGLFEERPITALSPTSTKPTKLPVFNGTELPRIGQFFGATFTYQDHFYVARSNLTDATPLIPWVDTDFSYIPFSLNNMNQSITGSQQLQGYRASTIGFGTEVNCSPLFPGLEDHGVAFVPADNGTTAQLSTSHKLQNGTKITCYLPDDRGTGNMKNTISSDVPIGGSLFALESMQTMSSTQSEGTEFCQSLLVGGWVRGHSNGSENAQTQQPQSIRLTDVSSIFIGCRAQLRAAHFDLTVDSDGRVLRSEKTGDVTGDVGQFFKGNNSPSALIAQSWVLLTPSSQGLFEWHNDTITSDWMSSLLSIADNSTDLIDPSKPLPDAAVVGQKVEALCRQLFAILLGLNTQVFAIAGPNTELIPGNIVVLETRIFIAPVMAYLCIAVLVLHLVAAGFYYAFRPKVFLPRMPTSIAAVMSYVCSSHITEDIHGKHLEDQRYGYGRYIGRDGESHVGIERQRNVVPWASENHEVKRRKWRPAWKGKSEAQPDLWI